MRNIAPARAPTGSMGTFSPVVSASPACRHCATALATRRITCDGCNPSLVDWQTAPLQWLKAKALQQYAAQIRSLARGLYRQSSRPKCCASCGYTTHYEVCHIKPISEFLPTDFVADVNKLSNLVALCRNHHWEFDHDELSTSFFHRTGRIQPRTRIENKKRLPFGNRFL